MRRIHVLAALAVVASCGGGPTAPSAPAPPLASALPSGAYQLTVSMSTGGSGISACVWGGGQPAFAAIFVPTTVHVIHNGTQISVAPDDPAATFRMQLQQLSGVSVSGTASGQFVSGGSVLTVAGRSGGAADAIGSVGATFASGTIDGNVGVQGMTCMNNGHTWTLVPRL